MKIRGLRSNFAECESFLESNSPEILALSEINLTGSIDSGNFFVRDYLPLIQKDSVTHMYGLAVYLKEGLPFGRDLSLENCRFLGVFDWLYFTQCLISFSIGNISVTPRMVKKVIMNPDLSKASGTACISVVVVKTMSLNFITH